MDFFTQNHILSRNVYSTFTDKYDQAKVKGKYYPKFAVYFELHVLKAFYFIILQQTKTLATLFKFTSSIG